MTRTRIGEDLSVGSPIHKRPLKIRFRQAMFIQVLECVRYAENF